MTFTQSPRWAIDLWLVGLRERLSVAARRASRVSIENYGAFARFVDRVSPWGDDGYQRIVLRRALYHVRFPRWYLRRWSTQTALRIVTRLAPYTGPGRFEIMAPATQLKVRWLDAHSDWNSGQAGGADYPYSQLLFADVDVPWAAGPEWWVLEYDEQGFIVGVQYPNGVEANVAFTAFETQVSDFYAAEEGESWDPYDHYGTPEHEAWLMDMERRGDYQ